MPVVSTARIRAAYTGALRAQLDALARRGAWVAGSVFSPIVLVKGRPNDAELAGGELMGGSDGTALRAALERLGYAPEDFCGLASCDDAGAPLPATLLREALEYETPKVVLLNIQAMTIPEQDTESYNRMVFDGMRWSKNKLEAILETRMEEEHLTEYLFPLLRYHDRWKELTAEDFRYAFQERPERSYNGYYLRADIRPYTEFPAERRKPDYTFPEKNYEYLDRIEALCREKGIALVLMKAPSLYPEWPEPYEEQVETYAEEHGLLYLNTLEEAEAIGLDFSTDTYDEGLHLNVYGAEKVSSWLGRILKERYGLSDQRSDSRVASVYNEKLTRYEAEKEAQRKEFEELGYISKFQND